MAAQGAALQNHNNELVKCKSGLRLKLVPELSPPLDCLQHAHLLNRQEMHRNDKVMVVSASSLHQMDTGR